MKTRILGSLCLALFFPISALAEDHPLVGRYENANIVLVEELSFASFPFVDAVSHDGAPSFTDVEGKVTHLTYTTGSVDTVLRVARNYEMALVRDGFEIVVSCPKTECGSNIPKQVLASDPIRLSKFYAGYVPGSLSGFDYLTTQTSWDFHFITAMQSVAETDFFVTLTIVQNTALGFVSISQDVVERQAMQVDLVTEPVGLEDLVDGIHSDGHIALDGVYFDTGLATITASSNETMLVIAEYLKQNPSSRFRVVGHTDSIGNAAFNQDLSERRAQAVHARLIQQFGIPADQLTYHGVGEFSPVSTNEADAGRALNRRVELVLNAAH